MNPRPFRPSADGLEPRLVLSADPAAVVAAYNRTIASADELLELGTHLQLGRTSGAISFLASHLPQVAAQAQADARTLSGYRIELQADIAANPSANTTALQQFLAQVTGAEVQADLNGAYATVYGIGFGAPPPTSPPPPPPAPSDPVFGPDTSSALPFSITDPNFQAKSDGVKVWDVTPGTGTAITTGSKFTATYTGYLPNGTVFDSSNKSGNLSTTLDTSHLIPGFVSGLDGMKVGGTRRIVIPAALGYGASPPANSGIPTNSDLVFEVNLLSSP